jgi:hypothetical protein
MTNYLLPVLNDYFEEIMSISGRLYATQGMLAGFEHYRKQEEFQASFISASVISYRDLLLQPDSDNLEAPDFHYELNPQNLSDEISNIVNKNCGLAIANAYEVFESYFVVILSKYFEVNLAKMVDVGLLKALIILSSDEIKRIVKESNGKNNKGLIKIAKVLSPFFKSHESTNYLRVNILQWFDLLSMVRHTLVHNRQVISKGLLDYLEKNKANKSKELFERQFERKTIDGRVQIFLTTEKASDVLTWLNSFAHIIFKSLSIAQNLPISVPRYIPPPIWR